MDPPPQSGGIRPAKPPVVNLPFFNVSTQLYFFLNLNFFHHQVICFNKASIQISKILDSIVLDPTGLLLAFIAVLILSHVVRSNTYEK